MCVGGIVSCHVYVCLKCQTRRVTCLSCIMCVGGMCVMYMCVKGE